VKRAWFLRNPELADEIRRDLARQYPSLHLFIRDGTAIVQGTLPICSPSTGRVLDRWAVRIELPADYPRGLPVVREAGDRIPRTPEAHMNADGAACVVLPTEWYTRHPDGAPLVTFLEGPVLSFFLGQSLRAIGEEWPFGEWSHGSDGIWQFYGSLFNTEDRRVIAAHLEVLSAERIKGHFPCPCGTGSNVRSCTHRKVLEELRTRVTPCRAREALRTLRGGLGGKR